MGNLDFYVEFNIEVPDIEEDFTLEAEQRLRKLTSDHSDLLGAAVSIENLVKAEAVLQVIDNPEVAIVDSRSPEEYSGEISYADRGGHIPGAVNLPWLNVLTGGSAISTTQDGWQEELQDEDVELFKSATEIQRILDSHGIRRDQEVITYCQTLWRGAHTYFFLLRLMGYENVRGYDGSWAAWGNRPDPPVVVGIQTGGLDMVE